MLAVMARNIYFLYLFFSTVLAGTVHLPAYPLAVRNPWLSAWLKGDASDSLPTGQATFWNGETLGWEVMVQVDNAYYTVFGYPSSVSGANAATQKSISYTSTHTYVSLTAGDADLTLDFFSPVSPYNFVRQSLPYSYLIVTATTTSAVPIKVFSAIDESWTGQTNNVENNLFQSDNTYMYTLNITNAKTFNVKQQMAAWGSVVYATQSNSSSTVSASCGTATSLRSAFTSGQGLANRSSSCSGGSDYIYAYMQDLGTVSSSASVSFAVGQSREDAIEFMSEPQSDYYQATLPTIPQAVDYFFSDYNDALSESFVLDAEVLANASAVSTEYADILEASVRQVFGALEVTIPTSTLDTSNPMVFLKEISSDGDIQTIDCIYPTFPILYLMCPEWIKMLLEPHFIYLDTGGWTNPYMIHDLGKYPIANGHDNNKDEYMPLESTGSMMVLLAAYQNITGDTAFASKYSSILQTYADYLVQNGMAQQTQLSTVDAILGHLQDQTMLVVQSAIGLTAYGAMTSQQNYTQAGLQFADKMYTQGQGLDSSRTHFTFNYGSSDDDSSWSIMFPFFADSLLSLSTFPCSAYTMQSTYYTSIMQSFGLAYKDNIPWGITDWNMWSSAVVSTDVMTKIINTTHAMLTNPQNTKPFQTKYLVSSGTAIQNIARSTVGSNFAILAMKKAMRLLASGSNSGNSTSSAAGESSTSASRSASATSGASTTGSGSSATSTGSGSSTTSTGSGSSTTSTGSGSSSTSAAKGSSSSMFRADVDMMWLVAFASVAFLWKVF